MSATSAARSKHRCPSGKMRLNSVMISYDCFSFCNRNFSREFEFSNSIERRTWFAWSFLWVSGILGLTLIGNIERNWVFGVSRAPPLSYDLAICRVDRTAICWPWKGPIFVSSRGVRKHRSGLTRVSYRLLTRTIVLSCLKPNMSSGRTSGMITWFCVDSFLIIGQCTFGPKVMSVFYDSFFHTSQHHFLCRGHFTILRLSNVTLSRGKKRNFLMKTRLCVQKLVILTKSFFVTLLFCKTSFIKVSLRTGNVLKRGTSLFTLLRNILSLSKMIQSSWIMYCKHGQVVRSRLYFKKFRCFAVARKCYLHNWGGWFLELVLLDSTKNTKSRRQRGQKGFTLKQSCKMFGARMWLFLSSVPMSV